MRRSLLIPMCALALTCPPAAFFAQTPPAQTPPAQTPPAPAAQPAAPATPKLGFTTNAGLLLVQIKSDQTAAFEELVGKLKMGLGKAEDAELKQRATSFKVYKASEGMGGNSLYVVVVDPATPNAEYAFLDVLAKTMTADEQRTPEAQAAFQKYAAAFAAINKLNLTPVGGGM